MREKRMADYAFGTECVYATRGQIRASSEDVRECTAIRREEEGPASAVKLVALVPMVCVLPEPVRV